MKRSLGRYRLTCGANSVGPSPGKNFFFLVAFFSLEELNDLKCINRVKDLLLD